MNADLLKSMMKLLGEKCEGDCECGCAGDGEDSDDKDEALVWRKKNWEPNPSHIAMKSIAKKAKPSDKEDPEKKKGAEIKFKSLLHQQKEAWQQWKEQRAASKNGCGCAKFEDVLAGLEKLVSGSVHGPEFRATIEQMSESFYGNAA